MKGRVSRVAVLVLVFATVSPSFAQIPVTVSPGRTSGVTVTDARCPTFSWGEVAGASAYELVVYRINAEGRQATAVLRESFSGAVGSWTPSLDRCLQPGARYAWSVRAASGDGEGRWSPPSLFRVASGPSRSELEQAIALVQESLAGDVQSVATGGLGAPQRRVNPGQPAAAAEAGETAATGMRWRARPKDPAAPVPVKTGLSVALDETSGVQTLGVLAISQSSEESSGGVLGISDAASGNVAGVQGWTRSPEGVGVLGLSNHAANGVGVVGEAEGNGVCAGVAGLVETDTGFGGLFWNAGGGDALVVANPADYPTSVDVKFFVDPQGNVGLEGVIQLTGTDSPPPCDAQARGAVYFDSSESWLCLCDGGPGWKRVDDPTDDCSS